MVKEKIQDIAEDRADLTEQMPSQQNDEIGELGAWFNTLTAKLDTILKERLAMLDTINIESEKREVMAHWYKSILDSIPFLISVQDTEMKWIFINTALENILGKKREEIVGSLCSNWDISICNTESCAIACVKRGLNKTRFLHNGASYQVDVTILKDLQGKETGFIEVIQDISEMEQMTRQQAEAEAASRAKSEFLSNMSHEMRTPMNAIIGMTAIGKAANDIERTKYALGKIEDASTHLLGVINDILDMSKIEAGKLNLSMEDFNFEKMLQRVVNVISFRVNEKGQKFNLFMDKAIPPVLYGDDQRLAQIIVNLLGNAVKFTPGGGSVYLNARLIKEENDVCTIQIEVVDSGIGLSSEQQSRLFQSFQQAESSTTRKFGGTGLGLAISKSIVEMMGGRIWVESELDKGATFAFTVQLKHGDAQKYEIEHRETNWKGLRILAVDDNAGILGYMKNFIESFGACCDTAASGNEAMELAEQNDPYDIFFVDWRMPDIDALQLTRVLRTIDSDKNKTIVTMISSIEWGDIEEVARKAGVDGFLPKPLFPSAIEDIINKFLGVVQEHIDSAAENIQVTFSGKRILLAEDVGVNREIVLSLLEPMLINIDCAENGKEAVQMFKEAPEKYDMIFMDVQMPEMDGFEATRVIRAFNNPRAKTIPIIALTANVFREDIDKCIEVGMNDHLGKPLDFAVVIDSLRRYLN
jgi:PAS domain S-box-containing protein